MASKQSDELKRLYQEWVATISSSPAMSLEEWRDMVEHWAEVTAEPREVDYVETVIAGDGNSPILGSLLYDRDTLTLSTIGPSPLFVQAQTPIRQGLGAGVAAPGPERAICREVLVSHVQ